LNNDAYNQKNNENRDRAPQSPGVSVNNIRYVNWLGRNLQLKGTT